MTLVKWGRNLYKTVPMKILLIGSGGREHALVWKLAQSSRVKKIYCAPGNPGIAGLASCVPVQPDQIPGLLSFAKQEKIDLVVVGPEVPLTLGIADRFAEQNIPLFGPKQAGARLEGSKVFTKDFLRRHRIPTAHYETFSDFDRAVEFLHTQAYPIVLKADGLAAGKGVLICQDRAEAVAGLDNILRKKIFGEAGRQVVIEEFLQGVEVSFHALVDGHSVLPLDSSQDHKRVGEGDTGLNTGGMGAYSPAPFLTPALEKRVMDEILIPTLSGLKQEGIDYQGVLYAGLMLTKDGPKLLEYNVRFGDPETQVLMMRLENDLVDLLEAVCTGRLKEKTIRWKPGSAVTVVMAAPGYPGVVRKGDVIEGLDRANSVPETAVFHAGTALQDGKMVTNGGRVLSVTATGKDLRQARERAYDVVEKIHWRGVHYRRDIGLKGMG